MERMIWGGTRIEIRKLCWFLVGFIAMLLLFGCATTTSTALHPNEKLLLREPVKEVIETSHFLTFKAPPEGVEVVAIDTTSGKELLKVGTTPVRVLLLRKKLGLIDRKVDTVFDIKPAFGALTYGKGVTGGVEFQFKFRKEGFSDQMVLERVPFLMGDSDRTIEVKMVGFPKEKAEKK